MTNLFDKIKQFLSAQSSVVIAIDGRCGSGKTTLAACLARRFGGRVVHMDDFFLPAHLRTPERLAQIGGNIHTERLIAEVMSCLTDISLCYNAYRCKKGTFEKIALPSAGLTIIEGSYSMLPQMQKYYDLKIFCDISTQAQKRRIISREKESAKNFFEKWIPMEEAYFSTHNIRQASDIILDMEIHEC